MPPWGRPPGGRQGRRGDRRWEMQQMQYDDRVEELDTDDDGFQGVGLDQAYGSKRFYSDDVRFAGIDMGGRARHPRRSEDVYEDDFTASDEEDDYDTHGDLVPRHNMQLVYREKEDELVQRALERIARARALGKPNVKLSRAEIDALDRLERNRNPPQPAQLVMPVPVPVPGPSSAPVAKASPKSKKEQPTKRKQVTEVRKKSSKSDNKSNSGSPTPKAKSAEGRTRGRSTASNASGHSARDDSLVPYPVSPDQEYVGRRPPYPADRYVYSSRQGSRTNSTQSLRAQLPVPVSVPVQMPSYQHYQQHPYPANPPRYYSETYATRSGPNPSRASRADPSDPDWEHRGQSSSSLVNVPLDQLPYQTGTARAPRFDPNDPRFGGPDPRYGSPSRRVVSGPAATHPQPGSPLAYRRSRGDDYREQLEVMQYLAPSESEDDDSDYDEGVQVDVQERAEGYAIQTRSATASSSKTNGKTSATRRRGK